MTRKVRSHRFRGVKYQLDVDEPYVGLCDNPESPNPFIRIPNGLGYGNGKKAREDLLTLLHECCHAENWKLSEDEVDNIAYDIGTLLWRLGYRRIRSK